MIYAPAVTKFEGCQFLRNYASEPGDALTLQSTSGSVANSIFKANYVTTKAKGGGSIAMHRNATTRFDNSRFESHHGDRATAFFIEESTPVLTSCIFTLNSALLGVVEIVGKERAEFFNCGFNKNQATGAIGILYLNNKGATLFSGSNFTGNFAPAAEGAAVSVGVSSTPTFDKALFSNNIGYLGGGVYVSSLTATIFTRSVFSNNTAESGGGAFIAAGAAAKFEQNSNFEGNNATASNG